MVIRTAMTSGAAAVVPDLVSVITPCYNAAPFVGEAIAAVQAQTYAPVEHLIVDDGSTDGSWAVLQAEVERVAQGAGIRAVRLAQNRGASHARNVGVGLAPGTVAALVAAVRDRPGALGVCPWQLLRRNRAGAWVRVPPAASLPVPGADHLREYLTAMCAGWVPVHA